MEWVAIVDFELVTRCADYGIGENEDVRRLGLGESKLMRRLRAGWSWILQFDGGLVSESISLARTNPSIFLLSNA